MALLQSKVRSSWSTKGTEVTANQCEATSVQNHSMTCAQSEYVVIPEGSKSSADGILSVQSSTHQLSADCQSAEVLPAESIKLRSIKRTHWFLEFAFTILYALHYSEWGFQNWRWLVERGSAYEWECATGGIAYCVTLWVTQPFYHKHSVILRAVPKGIIINSHYLQWL